MGQSSLIEQVMAKQAREGVQPATPPITFTDTRTIPDNAPGGPFRNLKNRQKGFVKFDREKLRRKNIITAEAQRSRTVEEFRLIKRNILTKCAARDVLRRNLILVTSAVQGEGKTFTSINLAMSIALEHDHRVLLIDCDLTKATLTRMLGIEARHGLIDVLSSEHSDISEMLIKTDIDGFSVLAPGNAHLLSAELLASNKMTELMDEISNRYEDRIVVIDAPPVLATSETSILAQIAGQIIFVVAADKTPRDTVKEAIKLISRNENINLLLNQTADFLSQTRFGVYYQDYK